MIPITLVVVSLIFSFLASPYLPSQVATHWGITGAVNGYSSKAFGLFFLPVLTLVLIVLFKYLPKADPYKKNFAQFKSYYDNFVVVITGFLAYLHILLIVWNLGFSFDFIQFFIPGIAILFFYTGVLTTHAKRNWFVGFRTPWTLSSEKVWNQTHHIGGKLFQLSATISLLGIIWPNLSIFFLLIPLLITVLFIFIYSYWLYRKLPL